MLNKKAIAAFAAGATLLSGMAFAAPAFVSAPAFAVDSNAPKSIEDQIKDAQKAKDDAKADLDKKNGALKEAKDKKLPEAGIVKDAAGKDAAAALTADAAAHYTFTAATADAPAKVEVKAGDNDSKADVAATATAYLKASFEKDKAVKEAQTAVAAAETVYNNAVTKLQGLTDGVSDAKKALEDTKKAVDEAKKAVDKAFPAYVKAFNDYKAALKAEKKAQRAVSDLDDSTPDDQKQTNAYQLKLRALNKALNKAKAATKKAQTAMSKASEAFGGEQTNKGLVGVSGAVKAYDEALAKYREAYKAAKAEISDMSAYTDPDDLELDASDYDVTLPPEGGNTGSGSEGQGGSGEGGSTVKVDYKAVVEFAVKYAKDAKSDAKTVKAVKAALAKVTAAKKAKDAKALVAALKELKALVDPLMKKQPKKSGLEALLDPESVTTTTPFGTNTLFTNYKGLYVELLAHGLTNVRAYNVLLDKLEYGLHNGGWENVIKNFPEHDLTVENTCGFLASLRAQLRKAVKHYEHVQAAVKDIQVELKADYDEAVAKHRWDDVKVIESKMAQAGALMGAANSNRTRAKALLNSADDHAADLHCDTQAKDVRKAMDKEPNSPFKKSGQKNNAQKPEGQNGQKPNGGAAGRQLGKTGATVALVAVAASVLAGMGAALRKIRH